MFGIEIEVENLPEPPTFDDYRTERDGSLRNNGVEYISDIIPLERAISSYAEIVNSLTDVGADFNERCGVHIHFDVRGLSKQRIKRLLGRYVVVERLLMSLCGADRSSSNFCLPLLEADGDKQYIKQWLNGTLGDFDFHRRMGKYSALNLKPIGSQGSMEFRMLPSDGDVQLFNKVINIINEVAYGMQTKEELAEKLSIPKKDFLEALAFIKSLDEVDNSTTGNNFLEKHFNFKQEKKQSGALTRESVLAFMEGL